MEIPQNNFIYFASESVGEGHPDKLCDQISDAILDECLKIDPNAKVALETATKTNMIVLLGEVTLSGGSVDYEAVARKVAREAGFTSDEIGLDADNCQVIVNVQEQDQNIAQAVHIQKDEKDMGAGD